MESIKDKKQQLATLREEVSKGAVSEGELSKRLQEINRPNQAASKMYTKKGVIPSDNIPLQQADPITGKVKISNRQDLVEYFRLRLG